MGPQLVHDDLVSDALRELLADRCTLTFWDSNEVESWSVDCYRTGGGDYNYGQDTDGDYELDLVLSEPDPAHTGHYWESGFTFDFEREGVFLRDVLSRRGGCPRLDGSRLRFAVCARHPAR